MADTSTKPFRFLDLPAELRNCVYALVSRPAWLRPLKHSIFVGGLLDQCPVLNLQLVSKEFKAEYEDEVGRNGTLQLFVERLRLDNDDQKFVKQFERGLTTAPLLRRLLSCIGALEIYFTAVYSAWMCLMVELDPSPSARPFQHLQSLRSHVRTLLEASQAVTVVKMNYLIYEERSVELEVETLEDIYDSDVETLEGIYKAHLHPMTNLDKVKTKRYYILDDREPFEDDEYIFRFRPRNPGNPHYSADGEFLGSEDETDDEDSPP